MSTTTIDSSAIDGTEDGILVLADIKAQILNAENDMQLRPIYTEAAVITGLWTFNGELNIIPITQNQLTVVHPGLEGGNTQLNGIKMLAGPSNEYSAFRPVTDGVEQVGDNLAFYHASDEWRIGDSNAIFHEGNLQAGAGLDLTGSNLTADYTVSTAAPSGTPDDGHIWYRTL